MMALRPPAPPLRVPEADWRDRRRNRQRVVSEDRGVALEWPLLIAERHRSAGE